MLSRLLCCYQWYRLLTGGEWCYTNGRWERIKVTERQNGHVKQIQIDIIEPMDLFTDDTSLRADVREHLSRCEKENRRERS